MNIVDQNISNRLECAFGGLAKIFDDDQYSWQVFIDIHTKECIIGIADALCSNCKITGRERGLVILSYISKIWNKGDIEREYFDMIEYRLHHNEANACNVKSGRNAFNLMFEPLYREIEICLQSPLNLEVDCVYSYLEIVKSMLKEIRHNGHDVSMLGYCVGQLTKQISDPCVLNPDQGFDQDIQNKLEELFWATHGHNTWGLNIGETEIAKRMNIDPKSKPIKVTSSEFKI